MPPALAAIAPVVASGVSSIIKHKQASSAQKKQAAYEQQQAAQAEAQRKAAWEGEQSSPEALMKRQRYTMQLGKLAGHFGGVDKIPPSIAKGLQGARAMPTYTPGQSYIPKPIQGGGGWDIASGAAEALSYLDLDKLKGGDKDGGGGGSNPFGALRQQPKKPTSFQAFNPNFSSGTKDFG